MPYLDSAAVVPAAGKSSRFGGQKLLVDLNGRPLIRRTLDALTGGGVHDIVVVVGPQAPSGLIDVLRDLPVRTVVNPEPDRGMFSSIHTGLAVVTGSPVLVLPADMSFVTSATVRAVIDECRVRDCVIVPAMGEKRGHPVAMPRSVRDRIVAADPHGTLKDAFTAAGGAPVELQVSDPGILRDVDVPGDLTGDS